MEISLGWDLRLGHHRQRRTEDIQAEEGASHIHLQAAKAAFVRMF